MNSFLKSMDAASSGMNAQSFRIRVISENVSNIDTPGYRAKQLTFDNVFDASSQTNNVEIGRISLNGAELQRAFDPAHPMADESGYVNMSNVNLMTEMADGREANRSYEANLATFQQAREMYASLLDLLKG